MTSSRHLVPMDRRTLLGALGLSLLCGCNDIDNIELEVEAQATIPAGTILEELLAALDFASFQSIDLSQQLDNQGVSKKDVDSVHVRTLTLTITSPAGQNFDFLQSISFSVQTEGRPDALVAKLDPVPKGQTKLDLVVEKNLDLAPYVVAPSMRLTTSVQGTRPKQDTTVNARVVLDVDVNVTST